MACAQNSVKRWAATKAWYKKRGTSKVTINIRKKPENTSPEDIKKLEEAGCAWEEGDFKQQWSVTDQGQVRHGGWTKAGHETFKAHQRANQAARFVLDDNGDTVPTDKTLTFENHIMMHVRRTLYNMTGEPGAEPVPARAARRRQTAAESEGSDIDMDF